MAAPEIDRLIQVLSRLPGLGPRSARRAALSLIKKRELALLPLIDALQGAADHVRTCSHCGNLDATDPCAICRDERRDAAILCVVADVADLWALERTAAYQRALSRAGRRALRARRHRAGAAQPRLAVPPRRSAAASRR